MKSITRASINDAARLLDLQKLAYQSEAQLYNDFHIPPLMQTLGELESDFVDKIFLKVETEGQIIGSVKGHQEGETCLVERLIVHPNFQGQGIGTALLEQLESCFAQVERYELFTGHKSERNIRLYKRLGYKVFKREEINNTLIFVFMEKYKQRIR